MPEHKAHPFPAKIRHQKRYPSGQTLKVFSEAECLNRCSLWIHIVWVQIFFPLLFLDEIDSVSPFFHWLRKNIMIVCTFQTCCEDRMLKICNDAWYLESVYSRISTLPPLLSINPNCKLPELLELGVGRVAWNILHQSWFRIHTKVTWGNWFKNPVGEDI